MAQPVEEFLELALFLFESAQRFGAVLVEGVIAARPVRRPIGPALIAPARAAPLLGALMHALLHPLHAPLPPLAAMRCPASHSSTPEQEPENHQAGRPEQDETDDHQRDPSRLAEIVEPHDGV